MRPNSPTMREDGFRPTLGELQQARPWVWLWCERCQHHAPLACAVAVILWGPNASSDKLRAAARCTSCGNKGPTVQHPGWAMLSHRLYIVGVLAQSRSIPLAVDPSSFATCALSISAIKPCSSRNSCIIAGEAGVTLTRRDSVVWSHS